MKRLSVHSNKSLEWEIFEVFPEDVNDGLINDYLSLLKETESDTANMYQNIDNAGFIQNFWNTKQQEKGAI